MNKQLKSISMLAVTGLVVAAMVSCQDPDYPAASPSTTGYNTTSSKAIVVNASNAPSITALFENVAAGAALAPGVNTGYIGVPLGSDQVRITGAGGTLGTTDLSAKSTFLTGTNYTIFVTDTIARPKGTGTDLGGIRTLTVTDTLTAPAAGMAKVRFFNLAPDVSAASARLINASGTSTATLLSRAYRTATGTTLRYTSVPAGAYTVQVYSGATVPSSTTASALVTAPVTLADGKIYTLYSQGLSRAKTVSVGTVLHN